MKSFVSRALALAVGSSVLVLAGPAAPPAAAANTYSGTLVAAVKSLPVSSTSASGYDRELFSHWSDANKDCQDTRQEVLRAESKVAVTGSCSISKGKWVSYYDRVKTTDPSTFDIDHMVPLSEAWKSGASGWSAGTREAFANDLGDKRSLVAVSASSNRSKSDRDPAQWMPKYGKCRYVKEWTAVKIRWSLKVDRQEKRKLLTTARNCKKTRVTVTKAKIGAGSTSNSTASGLRVTAIAYDPAGTDTVNGEYVVLKNTTASKLVATGWTLTDAAGSTYTFPSFSLPASASVTLYTGSGTASSSKLYAGKGTAWWNNSGDSFTLKNAAGVVQQTGSYAGQGDGSVATFS